MAGKKRLESRLATVPEVLEILEDRKKDGEFGYEQTLVYEYMEKFAKVKTADAKKMLKELEEQGIDQKLALKFLEVMPEEPNLVKLILAMDKNRQPASDELVAKIIEIVKSHQS